MRLLDGIEISLFPIGLMATGWSLGQRHQSGYDVAGIMLFICGGLGLLLAFILQRLTRRFSWHNRWYMNLLTGILACGIPFTFILLYAQLHG